MADEIASLALLVMAGYAALGLAFALPFLVFGVSRVDPGARGAPPAFRLLILPGVVALWPVLLRLWIRPRGR